METTHTTGQRRRALPIIRLFRLFNNIPKLLLRSPLHGIMSQKLMLLTFTGRKSGKQYTVPISYVQQGQTLLVASDHPWWKNLQGKVNVHIWLRGKERIGEASAIADDDAVAELYRIILTENPTHGRFMAIKRGSDGQPDPKDLRRAMERGMAVIKIKLVEANMTAN